MTYSSLSKRFSKHSYFCGWYFRCQSDKQTLAIIPSVHKTKDSAFCTIQVITDKLKEIKSCCKFRPNGVVFSLWAVYVFRFKRCGSFG